MTIKSNNKVHEGYLESALKTGLSAKASAVYVTLLDVGTPLSPKGIIARTTLHRQYVYDALKELLDLRLILIIGEKRSVKYQAVSPEKMMKDVEQKRLETLDGVQTLMKLYDKSPAGVVDVIRGAQACIDYEFSLLQEAKAGDYLDIIGGAGMRFVELFAEKVEAWETLREKKKIVLRYIGSGDDVTHNKTQSRIKNESRIIPGIGDIVNVCIRPDSVSFNIYEPEIMTVRVKSKEAVASQRALFEVLWGVAK
jgi:sugar-specific transcriptional regulator TrmB